MYEDCIDSPKPGVPAAVSAGGAAGLPERPREGRAFGKSDFGGRAICSLYGPCRRGDQMTERNPGGMVAFWGYLFVSEIGVRGP
jgi:hypothetical protein